MRNKKLTKLIACMGVCLSLAGCSYTGRANMKVSPNGQISLESLWLVDKPSEGKVSWSDSESPYSLMKPVNPNGVLQLVEEIDRDVNGKEMIGWHVKARMSTAAYQKYYKSLLPVVADTEETQEIDSLTGEVITKTEEIKGEDIDLNDGKIHTISVANFAPKVQVKADGLFKKTYYISYVGILDSIPEEYREYIKDGFEFSVAPCGTVLDHNATEVSEEGIYTWKNEDINDLQIIFTYTDLYPIITVITIAGITAAIYFVAYLLIRYWTRPSQIYGYEG